jgi:hypothetical protein
MWDNNQSNILSSLYLDTQPYTISETFYTVPLRTSGTNNRSNRSNNNSNNNNVLSQLLQSFLQPIEVYPTQTQIETATRRVRYSDISRPMNTQCPISMDDFTDNDMVTVIRHCGHIFHTENLMNWFRSNCRCPVCRYDIRDFNSNASTEFFRSDQTTNRDNNLNDNSNNNSDENVNSSRTNNSLNYRNIDPSGNNINMTEEFLSSYLNRTLNRFRDAR